MDVQQESCFDVDPTRSRRLRMKRLSVSTTGNSQSEPQAARSARSRVNGARAQFSEKFTGDQKETAASIAASAP